MAIKKRNEQVLTPAQQQLLDACNPLLEETKEWYLNYATVQARLFLEWAEPKLSGVRAYDLVCGSSKVSVYQYMKVGENKLMESGVRTMLNYSVCNNGYDGKPNDPARIWIDEEAKKRYTERGAAAYHAHMIYKLNEHVMKYLTPDVKSVSNVTVGRGQKGYEVRYTAHYENGTTRAFYTSAIVAGGYNIQKMHYRYITK